MVVYRKFLPLLFWMCLGIKKQKRKIIYTTIGKQKYAYDEVPYLYCPGLVRH